MGIITIYLISISYLSVILIGCEERPPTNARKKIPNTILNAEVLATPTKEKQDDTKTKPASSEKAQATATAEDQPVKEKTTKTSPTEPSAQKVEAPVTMPPPKSFPSQPHETFGPVGSSMGISIGNPDPFAFPIPTDDDLLRPQDDLGLGPGWPPVMRARCGDGRVQFGEECDDGNLINTDGCNIFCLLPDCGNFILDLGEQCDDGNLINGDGCSDCCTFERCGNRVIDYLTKDLREQCDDGNKTPGDGCSPCCMFEICGNDVIDPGEECDDGNLNSEDGCSKFCQIEVCPAGLMCAGGTEICTP